jgi:hypothetical protein
MIDIEELEASAAATFDVVMKEGKKPSGFRVMGSSSEQYRNAMREIGIINIKAFATRKTQPDIASDEGATLAAESADRVKMAVLRRCVVGWFGFASKGADLPFSVEALERVLKIKPAWTDMLVREIEDDANFTKA